MLRFKQQGVTLMITLIILVVMTLSAIALVRSTDTANIISANVAVQQGATQSAQRGIETGAAWLQSNLSTLSALEQNKPASGYSAVRCGPADVAPPVSDWWTWWGTISASCNGVTPVAIAQDTAANNVTYVIERLCTNAGMVFDYNPASGVVATNVCDKPPGVGGGLAVYYRITAKVTGLKNTQSMVQVIMSM
jgi:Tfp pilus assembly protein PilX